MAIKVIGLDNREYKLSLSTEISGNASGLHKRVRTLLKKLFPTASIFEEVSLPGTASNFGKVLRADFIIPAYSKLIEVHGEQHYKYNTFFFKNQRDYLLAQMRDRNKEEWAKINDYDYVSLPYNQTEEEWTQLIWKTT